MYEHHHGWLLVSLFLCYMWTIVIIQLLPVSLLATRKTCSVIIVQLRKSVSIVFATMCDACYRSLFPVGSWKNSTEFIVIFKLLTVMDNQITSLQPASNTQNIWTEYYIFVLSGLQCDWILENQPKNGTLCRSTPYYCGYVYLLI